MNCEEAQALIRPFIKDELKMKKTGEFISHIEKCSACRDELEVNFLVEMANAEFTGDQDIDYDFANLLKNRIADKKRRIENNKLLAFLILMVCAVLLILGVYYFIIL